MRPDGNGGTERQPIGREVKRLADALSRLVREHMDLAKAEIREDVRRIVRDAAVGMMAVPFLLAALLLFDVALAVGLSKWLGTGWAFAAVGALNLLLGGALGGWAASRLKRDKVELEGTSSELALNRQMVQQVREAIREERRPLEGRVAYRAGREAPEASEGAPQQL